MPSLSVCTFTNDPPERVAFLLGFWRDIAEEIVVAVDRRVPRADLEPLLAVADSVIHAEFTWPLEANLAWLHDQCHGDWILRVDGDEVPSQALVDRLAGPGWDDDVTHLSLPRRWLWSSPDQMLDQGPWWPDPQLRLVRHGMARFGRGVHDPAMVAGPWRLLPEPLYHLDLCLTDETTRLAKARRYEQGQPGRRSDGGTGLNVGYYVPEQWDRPLAVTAVPEVDRPRVRLGLGFDGSIRPARDLTRQLAGGAAHFTTALAVDRQPRPPEPDGATVEVFSAGPRPWMAQASATVVVAVENRTDTMWKLDDHPPLRVAGRLFDPAGAQVGAEVRGDFSCPVGPGARELVSMTVRPTPPAGTYRLEVGVLREWVGWYDATDEVSIAVEDQRRVLVSSGISAHRHLGDDLIVRSIVDAISVHHLDLAPVVLAADAVDAAHRFGVGAEPDVTGLLFGDRAGNRVALRRLLALRRDAERHAAGRPLADPAHQAFIDVVAGSDALVLAGAGWLTSAYRQAQLIPKAAEVEVARALGVPVLFEAGTIGPLTNRLDRLLARRILAPAHRVAVRDGQTSALGARRLGVDGAAVVQVPDAASRPPTSPTEPVSRWLAGAGIEPTRPWAAVSCRPSADDGHLDAVIEAVRALADRGIASIFLPHCTAAGADDSSAGHHMAAQVPLAVPATMPNDETAVGLVSGAQVVIGDRFHLGVLAAAAGVPGVLLASTEFDRQRADGLQGTSVSTTGVSGAAAAAVAALERGRVAPAAAWDPSSFAAALDAAIQQRRRR